MRHLQQLFLKDVLDNLEELSLTLPSLKAYEEALSLDKHLEEALVDVYTEVSAIHFFRKHPHAWLAKAQLGDLRNDFKQTLGRVRRLSSSAEIEAEAARMRHDKTKYEEVLNLMSKLNQMPKSSQEVVTYYHIPHEPSPKFWGRQDALQCVDTALGTYGGTGLKTFALYGMGGVGKTQIALQYSNQARTYFKSIFWVVADSTISIGQSFMEIAKLAGLLQSNEEMQDTAGVTLRVKNWLAGYGKFVSVSPVVLLPC